MIKKYSPFVILSFLIFFLTACESLQNSQRKAYLYYQIGNDYLEQKNYPEALTNLLIAEKLEPQSPYILNSLGLLYFARDNLHIASQYLEKSIEILPTYSDARNNLARVYISQGRYTPALKQIKIILKDLTYSHPEKAQTNLGLIYLRQKKYSQAKVQLQHAIKLNKNYCPSYEYYGQTLMRLKEYETASIIFDQAIKICQNNPEEAHYFSGLSYFQMGRKDMALTRLKEVSKLYPTSGYAQKSRNLLKAIERDKK